MHFGGNDNRRFGVEDSYFIRNRCQVPMFKGNESARANRYLLTRWRLPKNFSIKRPVLHIECPLKLEQIRTRSVKRFIIDLQSNNFAVGGIHNGLSCPSKAISFLCIDNGPGFIK